MRTDTEIAELLQHIETGECKTTEDGARTAKQVLKWILRTDHGHRTITAIDHHPENETYSITLDCGHVYDNTGLAGQQVGHPATCPHCRMANESGPTPDPADDIRAKLTAAETRIAELTKKYERVPTTIDADLLLDVIAQVEESISFRLLDPRLNRRTLVTELRKLIQGLVWFGGDRAAERQLQKWIDKEEALNTAPDPDDDPTDYDEDEEDEDEEEEDQDEEEEDEDEE